MTKDVELFSATAPDINPTHVLYYTVFDGMRSESNQNYFAVLDYAEALIEEHGACLVDRSDKGTGLALGQRRR
jgi:hypothetical protein